MNVPGPAPSPFRNYGGLTGLQEIGGSRIVRTNHLVATAAVALVMVVASALALLHRLRLTADCQLVGCSMSAMQLASGHFVSLD